MTAAGILTNRRINCVSRVTKKVNTNVSNTMLIMEHINQSASTMNPNTVQRRKETFLTNR